MIFDYFVHLVLEIGNANLVQNIVLKSCYQNNINYL